MAFESEQASKAERVLTFRASRLSSQGGRSVIPAAALPLELSIYEDRVEEKRPGVIGRQKTLSIQFTQIAQVAMKRGLAFCRLTIESTGGHSIVIDGLSRKDADQARKVIEERMGRPAAQPNEAEPVSRRGNADELERLANLKERGILTEEEFAAAKKSLLGL